MVLITGSSRGIGAASAKLLARHGASIVINYIVNKAAADSAVKEIAAGGGHAMAVQADARSFDQVAAVTNRVVAEFGPVDILVLNAGMKVPLKPFMELSHDEFEGKVMGELDCFFCPVRAIAPSMIERRKGCIIDISSGLSRYAAPNFSAHTTAKSAVDGLMKPLSSPAPTCR